MSRVVNINCPGVRRLMAASFTSDSGLTSEQLSELAGLTKGTVATYIAPLLSLGMLHISGWRKRSDGQNNFVREYMPGPQVCEIPEYPGNRDTAVEVPAEASPIPHDPILFALLGISNTERKAA